MGSIHRGVLYYTAYYILAIPCAHKDTPIATTIWIDGLNLQTCGSIKGDHQLTLEVEPTCGQIYIVVALGCKYGAAAFSESTALRPTHTPVTLDLNSHYKI